MTCPVCESSRIRQEKILYRNQYIRNGDLCDFEIPNVPAILCEECGEISIPSDSEKMISEYLTKQIFTALREL